MDTELKVGARVKVRDDATMWGEPDAAPSTYAGETCTVISLGPLTNAPYEVHLETDSGRRGWFFKWELEVLDD